MSKASPAPSHTSALPEAMRTRAAFLLGPITRSARIIEIGAGFNPVAPKREGWDTKTVDVGTRSELIEKYRGSPGVEVDYIEEVDFVWTDGQLSDAVPAGLHGAFDAFIASHVIEHAPDMISFLDSAATLLAPAGVVILAIPDKRYCFDYFRPLTLTGDILAAHTMHRRRHSKQTVFNHLAYTVLADGAGAWGQHPIENLSFCNRLDLAFSAFVASGEDNHSPYLDVHAWQFTPASFQLAILELAHLKLTDWRVEHMEPTGGWCEFYVWLRRGGESAVAALSEYELNSERLRLLKCTLLETKEQIDFLLVNVT